MSNPKCGNENLLLENFLGKLEKSDVSSAVNTSMEREKGTISDRQFQTSLFSKPQNFFAY